MINDDEDEKNLDNFYPNSVLSQTSTTKNNQVPFNTDIDTITTPENQYHYLCRECHKFPLIDFCKDIKYIKYTCSCVNNKKILIKDLNEEINKNSSLLLNSFISINENNEIKEDYIKGLSCVEHNKSFNSFCKTCFKNICENCSLDHQFCETENFQKIDEDKMDILIKKIKEKNINYNEIISNEKDVIKIINCSDDRVELISKEEEKELYKLINIIIQDYINYPNYIHIFNIKNIFHFLEKKNELKEIENIFENEKKNFFLSNNS